MDNATAAMLGFLTGLVFAALPIYLIGLLIGLALKKHDPEERAMYAAVGAWFAVFFLAAWGFANGGSMRWSAGLLYIPAAILAFFLLRRHYFKLWQPDEEEA
jgi:hypothetical protein